MDEHKRQLKGSPSRDAFKRMHKELGPDLYACDLDFVLIEKVPTPDIIAALDYKQDGDTVSFAEVIVYNALIRRGIPVFIVKGPVETCEFAIGQYRGGHHGKPRYRVDLVHETASKEEFEKWERSLREEYAAKFGR